VITYDEFRDEVRRRRRERWAEIVAGEPAGRPAGRRSRDPEQEELLLALDRARLARRREPTHASSPAGSRPPRPSD
jgi:hypothetical protein